MFIYVKDYTTHLVKENIYTVDTICYDAFYIKHIEEYRKIECPKQDSEKTTLYYNKANDTFFYDNIKEETDFKDTIAQLTKMVANLTIDNFKIQKNISNERK